MKKIVTIKIEVDMENPCVKEWEKPSQYFESEVDEVLGLFSNIGFREFSKYSSEKGETMAGNNYELVVKKEK